MDGEHNLDQILSQLSPILLPPTYVFCSIQNAVIGDFHHTNPLACVAEEEGLTLVLEQSQADRKELHYQGTFRCIRLEVHSSLQSVGLTAVVSSALAEKSISANIIAGYYHDHILVPTKQAKLALQILDRLDSR